LAESAKSESKTYRIVVLNRNGTEALVVCDGAKLALPCVEIAPWQRVAENLTATLKDHWGEEAICLFTLPQAQGIAGTCRHRYQVAEHWRKCGESCVPTSWVELSTISPSDFRDRGDHTALCRAVDHPRSRDGDSQDGPFVRLGWFKEFRNWLEAALDNRGLHLRQDFQQVSASPSFSLIRCETDGPAVWFKAVGEPNLREFHIASLLAERFPRFVPRLLASRPEWHAWVSEETVGTTLNEVKDILCWQVAAARLADLQFASRTDVAPFLSAGAHDLRIARLCDLVGPFFRAVLNLMKRQKKIPPAVLNESELTVLEARVFDALALLKELGIPSSLGHLDLNPGNVIVSSDDCRFLDWAEGYVGPPFLTLEYLLQHYRRTTETADALDQNIAHVYYKRWEDLVPPDVLVEARAVGPLVAVFAYAVADEAWMQPEQLEEPENAGYLRSLARRMWRESSQLTERTVKSF
jgi:Phosphotransferase enzyme family